MFYCLNKFVQNLVSTFYESEIFIFFLYMNYFINFFLELI